MAEPVKKWPGVKAAPEAPKAKTEVPKPVGYLEYPKLVYRGQEVRTVNNAEEDKLSAAQGFGAYAPEK